MTGGFSNFGIRTGWAFSGGTTIAGFPPVVGLAAVDGLAAGAGWACATTDPSVNNTEIAIESLIKYCMNK
jgi:hypothetical protein